MRRRSPACILAFAWGVSCAGDGEECPGVYGARITDYGFKRVVETPGGVSVAPSGQDVDLAAVDCIVDAVEACYGAREKGTEGYLAGIDRGCLKIKVAPDWFWNRCVQGHQLFPCDLSYYEKCRNRKEGECPCACAGVIQDYNLIVVTPDLAALSHELTHVVLGVHDPFPDSLQPCADGIRASNCATELGGNAPHARAFPPEPIFVPVQCGTRPQD